MKKRKLQKCNFLFSAEREVYEPVTLSLVYQVFYNPANRFCSTFVAVR